MKRFLGVFVALLLTFSVETACALTLTGTVQDIHGKPTPQAAVWLVEGGGDRVRAGKTDDAGRVAFGQVALGTVSVLALKDGYAIGGTTARVVGDAPVSITLRPALSRQLRVIDAGFNPIEGARVKLLRIGDLSGGAEFSVPISRLVPEGFPSVRSDADGVMTLPWLPADSYFRITLSDRNHAEAYIPYLNVDGPRQSLQMPPGTPVRGRVLDPRGEPAAGARVAVFSVTGSGVLEVAEAETDAEGYYVCRVPLGSYHIAATHPKHALSAPQSLEIDATAEQAVADLTLRAPLDLQGRVLMQGKPLGGVEVQFIADSAVAASTLSANDGAFQLRAPLCKGRLHLLPPDGFQSETPLDMSVDPGTKTQIDVGVLRVLPLPALKGVVHAPSGEPQPGVVLTVTGAGPVLYALTGTEGNFSLQLDRAPKEGNVRVRAEDARRFWRKDLELDLRALPPTLDVALEPFEPNTRADDPAKTASDFSILLNKPAPELECAKWYNGAPQTLAALKGKVVVLWFWGEFAVRKDEGRDRFNELRALFDALRGDDDVRFVTVHDAGTDARTVETFIKEQQIDFLVGLDGAPFKTFNAYGIKRVPQALLLDKEGVVRYADTEGRLLELIKALRR